MSATPAPCSRRLRDRCRGRASAAIGSALARGRESVQQDSPDRGLLQMITGGVASAFEKHRLGQDRRSWAQIDNSNPNGPFPNILPANPAALTERDCRRPRASTRQRAHNRRPRPHRRSKSPPRVTWSVASVEGTWQNDSTHGVFRKKNPCCPGPSRNVGQRGAKQHAHFECPAFPA
jgi:hypothetical protein